MQTGWALSSQNHSLSTLKAHLCVHNPGGSSTGRGCLEFFLGFHYVNRAGRILSSVCWSSVSSLPPFPGPSPLAM